jgi:hypothetical protein
MQTFELPDAALMKMIQDYSRPLTRPDWRTCKREESWCIEMDTTDLLDKCIAYVDAEESDFIILLKLEMQQWTHYGRIRILDNPIPWDEAEDCWYVERCVTLHHNYTHGIVEPSAEDVAFDAYLNNLNLLTNQPPTNQPPLPYEPEPSEYNYVPESE